MRSNEVKLPDARALVMERDVNYAQVGDIVVNAVMRGKYVSRARFLSALEKGFGFCDIVLGWNCNDWLYDNIVRSC